MGERDVERVGGSWCETERGRGEGCRGGGSWCETVRGRGEGCRGGGSWC